MVYYVYVLIDDEKKSFYIGSTTKSPQERLSEHNNHIFAGAFTTKHNNWKLHFQLQCNSHLQALKIEKHLKNMKSKKYLFDLVIYSEIGEKLLNKYPS